MADIRPFQAIRPAVGLEDKIAALPYDVYSSKEAREIVQKDTMSFLRIDRAETQFPESVDMYSDEVYQKAHDMLWGMVQRGEFIREQKACYYLYELVYEGRIQDGIAACASIDDYMKEVIKKHENTRPEKEQDRINHITACNAQTGPIFLAYRQQEPLMKLMEQVKKAQPVYDFTCADGVTHRVWVISEEKTVEEIAAAFGAMEQIYIADGHHRAASAVKVGLKKREMNPDYNGSEEFNYFLCVLFADTQLRILDYNRVVKDLNGLTQEVFLEKLKVHFEVEERSEAVGPQEKGSFGMLLGESWYELRFKEDTVSGERSVVDILDVSVLQDYVLDPLLGIKDPKTDKRIDFVGGIRGLGELEKRVSEGWAAAFSMYPTSMKELFDIADQGMLMPPKSTWFEPKLRSGIFIHEF